MRMIDLALLIDKFNTMKNSDTETAYCFKNNAQNLPTEWDYIDDVIESTPIITDPQPVIYAHWYAPTNDVPTEYCSNCNTPSQWWFDEKHCPNCGAKMREE